MSRCALCERSYPSDRLNRMHGLDICDPCRGAPSEHVGPWATCEVTEKWEYVSNGGDSSVYAQIIDARAGGSVALPMVSFSQESLGWLTRLFRKEVQVGDPLFDDTVWVSTEEHEDAARLLGNEGVQSAVLDAVTMPASLRLVGTQAHLRTTSTTARPPGECGVLVLAILRHALDMSRAANR